MKSVAVIGAGIGGLTAAGLLAVKGHRVTLFEASQTVGGKAQVFESPAGVRFDTGPTVMTMPATLRATFEALQATSLMPALIELELQTHYRFADGQQLSCFSDLERTAASAAAIDAGEAEGIRHFYRTAARIYEAAGAPYLEAPYESIFGFVTRAARRGPKALALGLKLSTLDALARSHFRTSHLQQFAGRFATYAGASPYEANAAFAMIAHLERAHGVHHVRGGVGALVSALKSAVEHLGVELRLGARAAWSDDLVVSEQKFDSVIINADPLASLHREDDPLAMSGCVFFFEAPQRLDLPHHTILFSSNARAEHDAISRGEVPGESTLHLCHPAATDASMAPEGMSGLYVMANMPSLNALAPAESWREARARLESWCVERIRTQVPSMRGVELTCVGARTPVDLAAQGAPRGSIYGYLPRGRLGPFRRPPMRAKTPGVFFTGGGTYPGGGVPLVMLSGQFAASLAHEHLRGGAP